MIPASAMTFEDLLQNIKQRATNSKSPHRNTVMVGVLFARPYASSVSTQVTSSLGYFHNRSGDYIDFYLPGYATEGGPGSGKVERDLLQEQRVGPFIFSDYEFDAFRSTIESHSKWRYSGGTDLLLFNANVNSPSRKAKIDFSSVIRCDLDKMIKDGAIDSIGAFFEEVFRYAQEYKGDDPTWGFSDREGIKTASSALKRLVLSLLPSGLGDDLKRAAHIAVIDYSAAK